MFWAIVISLMLGTWLGWFGCAGLRNASDARPTLDVETQEFLVRATKQTGERNVYTFALTAAKNRAALVLNERAPN